MRSWRNCPHTSCLQAAKHSTSFACGLHGHCPVCQYEPACLHRYFQGFLELLHCSERPPASPWPCRVSKLGWKETPLRRHKEFLHHRKLPSSTKEQNHCVTSVANLSVGHRGSWVLPPPPSGALLLVALSAHQRAVSNVQRGRKLCEPAEHHERAVHFPLEMGY